MKQITIMKIVLAFQAMSGGNSEEATPVPIPNTEVKLFSADGSWGFTPARVGRCQASIFIIIHIAGWSSSVARWAHNPKVAGSNPAPATNYIWSGSSVG